MWRSLLNSARGRSAVVSPAVAPYRYPSFGPPESPAPVQTGVVREVVERAVSTAHSAQTASGTPSELVTAPLADAPRCCCVHCGHVLYVPPKLQRIRCPRCSADLPAKDVVLSGEVTEEQILTAGRIIVMPEARVSAQLVACSVEIAGMVLGTVLASHTCRLKGTGKLAGNLLCRHLAIDPGAELEGSVELIRS